MKFRFLFLSLIGVAWAAAGCAGPAPDAFRDVRSGVAERAGYEVRWSANRGEDEAAARAVGALVARPLTAEGAAQVALLNNRFLQATFEELGVAQADFVQAGLLKNPVFDVSVRLPDRKPFGTYADVSAAEDFVSLFMIPAKKKIAEARLDAAKAKVAGEVFSLAADAKSAFYSYQAAAQTLRLRRAISEAAGDALDAAKRLREAGNVNDLVYLTERAQYDRAKIDEASAEAAAQEARETVNMRLGLYGPAAAAWSAPDSLPELPGREAPAAGLETLAIQKRADLAAARAEVLSEFRALGLTEQARWFEGGSLGVEAERETEGQWRVGPALSLPVPLFDQGQAALSRGQALLRQSSRRFEAMAVSVRAEVRSARARLYAARAKARFYQDEVLPTRQKLLDQTLLHFNAMTVPLAQLLLAKREEIDASREYVDSLREYWVARAELERAVGGRLPAAQDALPPASQPSPAPSHDEPRETHSHGNYDHDSH